MARVTWDASDIRVGITIDSKYTSQALRSDPLGYLGETVTSGTQLSRTWTRGHLQDLVDAEKIDQATRDLLLDSPPLLNVVQIVDGQPVQTWYQIVRDPLEETQVTGAILIPDIDAFLRD